jgi:5-methylcytosine-specific restriction protein B
MLEPAVKQKLVEKHQQMNNDGKLLSRQQLEQFYGTFRNQFGPEKLASLDGTALLETVHAQGNKESLVYWLEFKNDDEFPARFGGIGGGSAFKFGIFRRKETQTWVTSDESGNAKNLSVEDAVVIARKHRDQLLRGVELLKQVPPNGSDDDYIKLQDALDREAPDVSPLGWGHKYFHLILPEKLDHLHTLEFQRYHLLKLLQLPPDLPGRYVCAGRFVAAAKDLNVPMNNLMEILYSISGRPHGYWRIGTSDGKAPRNHWPMMRDGNCVAIGWRDLGNLSILENNKESKEKLRQLVAEKYPKTPQEVGKIRAQVFNYVLGIAEGDAVLASDGGTVIGIGRVTGPYQYDVTSDFPHRRPVEWLSFDEWKMPEPEGLQTTVHEMRKAPSNILEAERKIQSGTRPTPPPVQPTPPGAPPPRPSGQGHRLKDVPGWIQELLERKNQVIIYGPPGTGKTFWAGRAAHDLAAYSTFGKAFDELTETEKLVVDGGDTGRGLVRICCFHPAYGYEDFIEGYRPELAPNGQIAFRLNDGVFKRLVKDAIQHLERSFFLIVDEINRGDIPRIFGELLTVLEKDKRGKVAIVLPVSGETFRVPPNVFLIGTMNTADRSISLLDAALRRRFGFIELMPDSKRLRNAVVSDIPLGPWLEGLNRRIREHIKRDARNLQVGHSYLLQGELPLKDLAAFKRALRDDIIPLLEEYCYEDFSALQNILGNAFVDMDKKRIRHELFQDGQEADLLQALVDPEILASPEALSSEKQQDDVARDDEDGEEGTEQ